MRARYKGGQMKHYWEITSRYLKQNKKRTMFTIFGVALTVLLLYAGLNLTYGYLLQQGRMAAMPMF